MGLFGARRRARLSGLSRVIKYLGAGIRVKIEYLSLAFSKTLRLIEAWDLVGGGTGKKGRIRYIVLFL